MRSRFIVSIALAWLLQACAVVDLRPRLEGDWPASPQQELKGQALLQAALEAAGGQEAWGGVTSVDLTLSDEWRGWVGCLMRPWPGNPTRLEMHYELGMLSAQAKFLGGPLKGQLWGRDGRGTWSQKPGSERRYRGRESARFILDAYQYFFELPARIVEAPIVSYVGSRTRNARIYDLVFATWGRPEAHLEHDQYLLWISRETRLIEIAQYTIRDKFRFATGVNFFSDFRRVGDLLIPHGYRIARDIEDESFVHRVQLDSVQFGSLLGAH